VVWEGRRREAPPYPDHWHKAVVAVSPIDDCIASSFGHSEHLPHGVARNQVVLIRNSPGNHH
jgi:hypothetical protein